MVRKSSLFAAIALLSGCSATQPIAAQDQRASYRERWLELQQSLTEFLYSSLFLENQGRMEPSGVLSARVQRLSAAVRAVCEMDPPEKYKLLHVGVLPYYIEIDSESKKIVEASLRGDADAVEQSFLVVAELLRAADFMFQELAPAEDP